MRNLLGALAALLLACVPAIAQQQQGGGFCLPFKDALKAAAERFKESPAFVMVASNGAVLTLTVAKDGNWTLWLQANEKTMCVLATGEGFAPASEAIKALGVPGQET